MKLLLLFAFCAAVSAAQDELPNPEDVAPVDDDTINQGSDTIQFVNLPAADDAISYRALVDISPLIDPERLIKQFRKNPKILAGPLDTAYALLVDDTERPLEDVQNEEPLDYRLPVYEDPTWR